MKRYSNLEKLAFALQHQKIKPVAWQAKVNGVVVYEHTDIRLVHHYINKHQLNIKPVAKYNQY